MMTSLLLAFAVVGTFANDEVDGDNYLGDVDDSFDLPVPHAVDSYAGVDGLQASNAIVGSAPDSIEGWAEGSFMLGESEAFIYPTDKVSAEGGAVKIYAVPMTKREYKDMSYGSDGSMDSYGSDSDSFGSYFDSFTVTMVSYLNPGCDDDDMELDDDGNCNTIPALIPGGAGQTPMSLVGDMVATGEPAAEAEGVIIALKQEYGVSEAKPSMSSLQMVVASTIACAAVALALVAYRRSSSISESDPLNVPLPLQMV
jgi:hypothetical protein